MGWRAASPSDRRLRHITAAVATSTAAGGKGPPDPADGGGGGVHATSAIAGGDSGHGGRWPLVCGHRGLLLNAPENTLACFEACLALRIGFEFDVDRTRDGTLVCMHDRTVDRTTDGSGEVGDLTLAQLRELDCGSWYDPSFAGQRVPTIAEIFSLVASSLRAEQGRRQIVLACDIKSQDPTGALEHDLVQLALAHGVLDQLLFIGRAISEPEVRQRLAAASDGAAHSAALATFAEDLAAALEDEHSDWLYLRYQPSASEVAECHSRGKRVFLAGTTPALQDPPQEEVWRLAAEAEVDGFLTDTPFELPKS